MFKDRNITIIGHNIITVMYVLLTLNMFLQAEKLLLNHCNNIKMFVCTNFLQIEDMNIIRDNINTDWKYPYSKPTK